MVQNDPGRRGLVIPDGHKAFRSLKKTDQHTIEEMALARSGFGPQHWNLDFDGRYPKIEAGLRAFASQMPAKSIFLGGPVGPGKTGYLAVLLRHLFRAWALSVTGSSEAAACWFAMGNIYVTHRDFTKICLDGFRDPPDRLQTHTFDDLCCAPLLLFDDLAAVKETDYNIGELESLLEERWRDKLPTWFTSNISQRDLQNKNKYPDWQRAVSRLFDVDWMAVVELPDKAKDRRKEHRDGGPR